MCKQKTISAKEDCQMMVSIRKDLHYHMLILVQVRSKGGLLCVEQKM